MNIEPEFEAELRTWGNSKGIRIPAWLVKAGRLEDGTRLVVRVEKKRQEAWNGFLSVVRGGSSDYGEAPYAAAAS